MPPHGDISLNSYRSSRDLKKHTDRSRGLLLKSLLFYVFKFSDYVCNLQIIMHI